MSQVFVRHIAEALVRIGMSLDLEDDEIMALSVAALARSLVDIVKVHGLPVATADFGKPMAEVLDNPRLRGLIMENLEHITVFYKHHGDADDPDKRADSVKARHLILDWLAFYES